MSDSDDVDMSAIESAVATLERNEKGQFTREAALSADGVPFDVDKHMDAALAKIPDELRELAGMAKNETPSDVEAKAETPKATEGDSPKKDPKREEYLVSIRLAKNVPNDVLEHATDAQLAAWSAQATDLNRERSVEIQKRTEELKRAQPAAPDVTAKVEPQAPTTHADIQTALQAFSEFDDSFKKPMETLIGAAVRTARESVLAEVQPLIQGFVETRAVMAEMISENNRREIGERFPDVVADSAKYEKVQSAIKRLWGENGATYKDAAPTFLGRYRVCVQDACRIERDDAAPAKEEATQRKVQGLPAAPARKSPIPRPTMDAVIDDVFEQTQKRWATKP